MNPEIALTIWAKACDQTGIRWFLFKETLLCVDGYRQIPPTVPCAQIVVFGKDLPDLIEKVFPLLPEDWVLGRSHLGGGERKLVFRLEGETVLDISVLYGVEGEEDLEAVKQQLKEITRALTKKTKRHIFWKKLLHRLYTRTIGRLVYWGIRRTVEKTFPKVVAFAAASNENAAFYSDILTNKKAKLFPKADFAQTLMLPCADAAYPAFSGYRNYLAMVYGDYEKGLVDEIGCGLSVEEKQDLKAHQAHCAQALAFIQEISEEFGLRYYLLAGSVLGCVRHKGFIPWDDDVDLGIRIEDLARFEAVVKEEIPKRLPAGFTLVQAGPNNPYPRMFSKICYEGRCCMDLWPLVPTYTDGFRAKLLWAFAKIITKVHYYKIGHPVRRFLKIVKPMSFVLTDKMVMALARLNERQYTCKRTPAYINLYSIYRRNKETILRSWLDTETMMEFNGLTVPVVGCTQEYLTHLYGDYMWSPPPWKRASRHSARFGLSSGGTLNDDENE